MQSPGAGHAWSGNDPLGQGPAKRRDVLRPEATAGGLLASIIWQVGRRVLTWAVIGSNYNAYGVVGAFIAVMLWLYYGSAVVFFGAEYVQVICQQCRHDKPSSEAHFREMKDRRS
jgi:uncharacterized BrkB/YihY/UPF0761 family membrane protein